MGIIMPSPLGAASTKYAVAYMNATRRNIEYVCVLRYELMKELPFFSVCMLYIGKINVKGSVQAIAATSGSTFMAR